MEEEKRKYENEVTLERRQILKLSIEIDRNRTRLSKIKKDKMNNVKKLNALKMATSELENRKAISAGLVLSADERVAAVEEILAEYERQKDNIGQEVAKMREKRLLLERDLGDLVKEKEAAELEIKAIVKEENKTRKSINLLKETLQKKEDILYCHEFELAKLERHNARSQGREPEENRAALKEEVAALKVKLEEQLAAKRNIDSLVYKLEVSINRCNKEIETLKETNVRTEEESNETELVIETSARQAGFHLSSSFSCGHVLMCILFSASLKEKIQELTVEDKMLSMTEIKIKEEVKAMERELLEVGKLMVEESIVISIMIMIMILISMQVGRLMVEEEAVRREKIAGCNAAREMHEAQVVS